eukprot:CAMPEP_0173385936 /NCGR_PEP_ID=MMETSP1356-20130122/8542_1 /TAXON_ID=77927 ORGANISM="Hemiselmis virescens, Strain PCC157" /NCGR_SAMPLE_ID=MMETSP1356 /ASSEMBLY_ACC=CAM_ASM_000847 /LENGTH=53 /DNA_ID=CAMNT_0014341963 /DNA_START=136 /DNA_END=293 /DNA_ORIENTATION=-
MVRYRQAPRLGLTRGRSSGSTSPRDLRGDAEAALRFQGTYEGTQQRLYVTKGL